jgi:hypothetical protein
MENIRNEISHLPALSEFLRIVAFTKHSSNIWEYSRRLLASEEAQLKEAIPFQNKIEDERSISLSANIIYNGCCYRLTLFTIKK